jgi:hypothetical protein
MVTGRLDACPADGTVPFDDRTETRMLSNPRPRLREGDKRLSEEAISSLLPGRASL